MLHDKNDNIINIHYTINHQKLLSFTNLIGRELAGSGNRGITHGILILVFILIMAALVIVRIGTVH